MCVVCVFSSLLETCIWVQLLVYRYVSKNTASFLLCVVRHVKERRNVLHSSPLVKNTSVIQVVLDEWLPLKYYRLVCCVVFVCASLCHVCCCSCVVLLNKKAIVLSVHLTACSNAQGKCKA